MNPEREHSNSLRIEAYLAGEMNPEQGLAFEAECEADAALQDQLEQYLLSRHIVQRSGNQNQKDQWQDLRAEMRASQTKVTVLRRLGPYLVAAAVLFLLIWGGITLFVPTPAKPDRLFAGFYERPQAPERMGSSLVEAERHYRQGDYAQAIISYEAIAQDTSQSLAANSYLYWGIAYLELGQTDSALARLAELETLPEQRDWYTSLIYLKEGEGAKAQTLLQQIVADEQHFYRNQAAELLEKWAD
ncbi:MAG: tol-pal system YbgF family protein [Bacteroidia bacterium]